MAFEVLAKKIKNLFKPYTIEDLVVTAKQNDNKIDLDVVEYRDCIKFYEVKAKAGNRKITLKSYDCETEPVRSRSLLDVENIDYIIEQSDGSTLNDIVKQAQTERKVWVGALKNARRIHYKYGIDVTINGASIGAVKNVIHKYDNMIVDIQSTYSYKAKNMLSYVKASPA